VASQKVKVETMLDVYIRLTPVEQLSIKNTYKIVQGWNRVVQNWPLLVT
jgi:hypothetical protein